LKKAGVSSRELFKMIQDMKIKPSWNDIPLPAGKSSPQFSVCAGLSGPAFQYPSID
jgi:hypothetical protein